MVQQAVWFTTSQGLDGPVYGAADQWNGVGIFFDSFDNDGKVGIQPAFPQNELHDTCPIMVYRIQERFQNGRVQRALHEDSLQLCYFPWIFCYTVNQQLLFACY